MCLEAADVRLRLRRLAAAFRPYLSYHGHVAGPGEGDGAAGSSYAEVPVRIEGRLRNGRRFSDVSDNAFYWDFVVLSWLPIYFLIYWVPRL